MIEFDSFSKPSMGGTEIIKHRLQNRLPQELLNKFQIICDRIISIDETKIRLFWAHNTPYQLNNSHLENGGWRKFHRMIFISHHQMEEYVREYQIPYSHCVVMKYALEPVKSQLKPENKISLIYTSTPHRGLDILVNVFEKLCEEYDDVEVGGPFFSGNWGIIYDETYEEKQIIEYYRPEYIIVERFTKEVDGAEYDYDDFYLGNFEVPYEKLTHSLINEIFHLMLTKI